MAKAAVKKPLSQEDIDDSLAWAVAQGDIVNLRLQFLSFSPLREYSTENLHAPKYDYLHPENTADAAFTEAKGLLKDSALRDHIKTTLSSKAPVQLPAELLVKLADNAVRLGKYSNAAQAYELLRIRPRMQELFLKQADEALDQNDVATAARGYHIASSLSYDYAAFPEPLPNTRSYHKNALILHAVYPTRPEESIALQPTELHLRTAFSFLLLDSALARHLENRPVAQQIDLLKALIHRIDPAWDAFTLRYKDACAKTNSFGERLQREIKGRESLKATIAEAAEDLADERNPRDISAALLGYSLPEGDWWQYLKELTAKHPAAALFVSRQVVSKELEIILPRFIMDSPIIKALGLSPK